MSPAHSCPSSLSMKIWFKDHLRAVSRDGKDRDINVSDAFGMLLLDEGNDGSRMPSCQCSTQCTDRSTHNDLKILYSGCTRFSRNGWTR